MGEACWGPSLRKMLGADRTAACLLYCCCYCCRCSHAAAFAVAVCCCIVIVCRLPIVADRWIELLLFVAVSCYVIIVDVRAMLGCHAVVDVVKMLLLVALLAVLLLLRSLFIHFMDECSRPGGAVRSTAVRYPGTRYLAVATRG